MSYQEQLTILLEGKEIDTGVVNWTGAEQKLIEIKKNAEYMIPETSATVCLKKLDSDVYDLCCRMPEKLPVKVGTVYKTEDENWSATSDEQDATIQGDSLLDAAIGLLAAKGKL